MALTKETIVSKVEYLPESGMVQVQEATVIKDDGKEISRTFHRYVLSPVYDAENLADKPAVVQQVTDTFWTQEAIAARKAAMESVS